jgi:hypothetical protein
LQCVRDEALRDSIPETPAGVALRASDTPEQRQLDGTDSAGLPLWVAVWKDRTDVARAVVDKARFRLANIVARQKLVWMCIGQLKVSLARTIQQISRLIREFHLVLRIETDGRRLLTTGRTLAPMMVPALALTMAGAFLIRQAAPSRALTSPAERSKQVVMGKTRSEANAPTAAIMMLTTTNVAEGATVPPQKHKPADEPVPVSKPVKAAMRLTDRLPKRVVRPTTHPTTLPSTHHRVTDPGSLARLRDLSPYEMRSLQASAEYGDDAAAMVLAMAYETGQFVAQDCKRAAKWVMSAAGAGNPAAEYNLGVRYLRGDGVPRDTEKARLWLHRASRRHYRQAQEALADRTAP